MTDRKPIIAANWKMHKTHLEAIQAVQKLGYLVDAEDDETVEVVIVPPFTALRSVQTLIDVGQAAVRAWGAERLLRGQGRVHGRDLAADARRAASASTSSSATRSAANSSARTT